MRSSSFSLVKLFALFYLGQRFSLVVQRPFAPEVPPALLPACWRIITEPGPRHCERRCEAGPKDGGAGRIVYGLSFPCAQTPSSRAPETKKAATGHMSSTDAPSAHSKGIIIRPESSGTQYWWMLRRRVRRSYTVFHSTGMRFGYALASSVLLTVALRALDGSVIYREHCGCHEGGIARAPQIGALKQMSRTTYNLP